MFHIQITKNGATFLFNDSDNVITGFLIHREGIKEIVSSLPISKYYVVDNNNKSIAITKEQALQLYDMILGYLKNKEQAKDKGKKII